MRWGLAIVGLFAACGDNVRLVASGDRLEAIVDVGGDRAEALVFFRDRQLDLACVFNPDRAGAWRCMPRHAANIIGYADPFCSLPIYECRDCGDERVAIVHAPGCVVPAAVPVTLSETASPAFIKVAIGCVSATFPAGTYFTTSEHDASAYVEATFDDTDVTEELGARTLIAADGARQIHHGFARTDGRSCSFRGASGTPRCLPGTPAQTELGLAYFFAEDTCSSRVALSAPHAGCEATTHARIEGAVHVLEAYAATPFERSAIDSRCFPTLETELQFWTIGPIDTSLPAAELVAYGVAPARPVFYAAAGHPLEFARRWVDVDGRTCLSQQTATHGRRCIPRSVALVPAARRFAEPTCTMELVYNPEETSYGVVWEGIDDPARVTEESVIASVHPLRTYPATDVYAFEGSDCVLQPDPAVLMSYVGLPMDLQKFPVLERRPVD